MNQRTYLGLIVVLAFAAVLVFVSLASVASAARIDEKYAHNHITSRFYGTDKEICGLHVCAPGEIPQDPKKP